MFNHIFRIFSIFQLNYSLHIDLKDIIAFLTLIIGAITVWNAIREYKLQGKLKRVEKFNDMRDQFKTDLSLRKICDLLSNPAHANSSWESVKYQQKEDFLGFYEELALIMYSGLINKKIVHYMFGYYAIRCLENDQFKADINFNSKYWKLFKKFADEMKRMEDNIDAEDFDFQF